MEIPAKAILDKDSEVWLLTTHRYTKKMGFVNIATILAISNALNL